MTGSFATAIALPALTLAFLAGCSAHPAPPPSSPAGPAQRVVSVNLCTDELLLLLARPDQVASITFLSRDPGDSVLAPYERRFPGNDGSLIAVVRHRPDLVLTMGGRGSDRVRIAHRLGIRTLALPYPANIEDVEGSVRQVAHAIGRDSAGDALVRRIEHARAGAPATQSDAIFLTGGGRTIAAQSLGAEWMRMAGLGQRALAGDTVPLEQLLVAPPRVLLRSDYRQGQYSGEQRWLRHPLARQARSGRTMVTDGRRWTCMGPTLVPEILRLKRELQS